MQSHCKQHIKDHNMLFKIYVLIIIITNNQLSSHISRLYTT